MKQKSLPQTNASDVPVDENLGTPLDPTTNPQSMMGETYGMTGLGADPTMNPATIPPAGDFNKMGTMLSSHDPNVQKKLKGRVGVHDVFEDLLNDDLDQTGNETLYAGTPPSVLGEQMVSGDMPDPDSDDDMLLNSHQVGLRLEEDYENPQPLNMAGDIAAAELERRGSPDFADDDLD